MANIKTEDQIYNIYLLQSRNVRKLGQVKKSLIRNLNKDLRDRNKFEVEVKTKLLLLLYSTWSEAQFVQILHTPNGYSSDELMRVEGSRKRAGIVSGWNDMIELAILKVGDIETDFSLLEKKEKILEIIRNNIDPQSKLRNKIAHGQWVHALNSSLTNENIELTEELNSLDFVQIERLFEIHKFLGIIVRDLVQSPTNGFVNNYVQTLNELETYVDETRFWSVESKLEMLRNRPVVNLGTA